MNNEDRLEMVAIYNAYYIFEGTQAYITHEDLHGLHFSSIIFMENYKHLSNILDRFLDNKACELLSSSESEFKSTHLEVTRCFLNFISSAISLRDLSRSAIRNVEYLDENFQSENEFRIKELFIKNPVTKFIEEIRNTMMHQSIIPVVLNQSYTSTKSNGMNSFKGGFAFTNKELLKINRLGPSSRNYIESHKRHIYFHEFINEYKKIVCEYQTWLIDTLYKKHREKYSEFWVAQERYIGEWSGVTLSHFNIHPTQ